MAFIGSLFAAPTGDHLPTPPPMPSYVIPLVLPALDSINLGQRYSNKESSRNAAELNGDQLPGDHLPTPPPMPALSISLILSAIDPRKNIQQN